MDRLDFEDYYHVPCVCKRCSGVMVYQGVGEYKCEDCGYLDYDDYGKVRSYIEKHRGATVIEIERAIGVSRRSIRRMLQDDKIEMAREFSFFLHCELCGKSLRSGKYCAECEKKMHQKLEERTRKERQNSKNMKGFDAHYDGGEGHMRYLRDE